VSPRSAIELLGALRAKLFTFLVVERGCSVMVIWEGLVDDHGFAARHDSVRRFVWQLPAVAGRRARGDNAAPATRNPKGRLRLRAHGAVSADGQVAPNAPLRPDARVRAASSSTRHGSATTPQCAKTSWLSLSEIRYPLWSLRLRAGD
jgi:hypothetical protein